MRTLHEGPRGCGFRKGGGLYLMSDGIGMDCPLLPIEMTVCPCCGHGIKPARGWTWVQPDLLFEGYLGPHGDDIHTASCPLGAPGRLGERCGLLWIGENFYPTPEAWIAEGREMGFSRRVGTVPRGFVAGETWVLAGHRKAVQDLSSSEANDRPGIFHIWKPSRIEYVVKGTETEEELQSYVDRGIEPVKVVPTQQTIEVG